MSFQIKYLKYKNKYLDLKNLLTQKGGSASGDNNSSSASGDNNSSSASGDNNSSSTRQIIDSRQISEYLKSEKYDFKLFDINYTEQEQESIDNFKIENKHYEYTHIGSLSDINDLNTFLSNIGANRTEDIVNLEQIILNLIKKVLEGYDMTHFWLIVRVSKRPSNISYIPRWHRDGSYFYRDNITPKFATVLKGPGTVFIKSSTSSSEIFNKIEDEENKERKTKRDRPNTPFTHQEQEEINKKYHDIYASSLLEPDHMVQSGKNQGVIFFPGYVRDVIGAIHSEPKIDDDRIFISIVPGTKENVEEYKVRREELYRRIKEEAESRMKEEKE